MVQHQGFKLSGKVGKGNEVSYLLFANDTFIFCEANHDQVVYLGWTFMLFEA